MRRTDAKTIISEHMKVLGSRGGKAAARSMTPEQRRERAVKASRAAAVSRSAAASSVGNDTDDKKALDGAAS